VPLYDRFGFKGEAVLVYEPSHRAYDDAINSVNAINRNHQFKGRADMVVPEDLDRSRSFVESAYKQIKNLGKFEVTDTGFTVHSCLHARRGWV